MIPILGLVIVLASYGIGSAEETDVIKTRARAEAEDPRIQTDLGEAYYYGKGVSVDYGQAFDLVKQAAEKGFSRAQFDLAQFYQHGNGTPVDNGKAIYWLKKAADGGNPNAQQFLGSILYWGSSGQPVDKIAARDYYEKAALQGLAETQGSLAYLYLNGDGIEKDRLKGFIWALCGAEKGNAPAAYYVASCYSEGGDGIPKNVELAWTWSQVALLRGVTGNAQRKDYELQKKLSAELIDSVMGEAVRWALSYEEIIDQGNYIPSPDLSVSVAQKLPAPVHEKMDLWDNEMIVPVMINGKGPFHFSLDSGCSCSVINNSLAKRLELPEVGLQSSINNIPELHKVFKADYSIFGVSIKGGLFMEIPLDHFASLGMSPIDGILGGDFLSHFVVEIDYKSKTLSLFDPDTYRPTASAKMIPLQLRGEVPMITASMEISGNESSFAIHSAPVADSQMNVPNFSDRQNDPYLEPAKNIQSQMIGAIPLVPPTLKPIEGLFLVDTGDNASGTLSKAFDREYNFSKLVPKVFPRMTAILNGDTLCQEGRIPSISFGPFRINGPVMDSNVFSWPDLEPLGTIGAKVLRKFKVTFDYQHLKMYLEPTSDLTDPEKAAWTGFAIKAEGKDFKTSRIVKVFDLSPASEAGFKQGDEIIEVDGKSGDYLNLINLPWTAGGKHSITVKREGSALKLEIEPEIF